VNEILKSTLALCLCMVLFLPVSYALCWWADVLAFRRRSGAFRWLAAWGWSFALLPVLLYFLYWSGLRWLLWPAAALGWAVVLKTRPRVRWRHLRPALLLVAAVWALTLFAITEWTIGQRMFLSVTAFDHAGRVAFTHELAVSGVPPFNPTFAPGHPLPAFYYYFWYLLTSAAQVASFGLVPARQAVNGGVMYTFLGLLAVLTLSVWLLARGPRRRAQARLRWAFGLLLVSGLDIVVYLLYVVLARLVHWQMVWSTVEQWNEQVTSWMATALWVPHHLAAMLAGWLLYWESALSPEEGRRANRPLLLLRGAAVVSMFGMSIWVGITFALVISLWWLQLLARRRPRAWEWMVSGVVAGVLIAPFALELAQGKQGGGSPLGFGVREFSPVVRLFPWLDQTITHAGLGALAVRAAHEVLFLLCLPLNYALELGFLLMGAVLYWRSVRRGGAPLAGGAAWWPLLGGTAFVVTFVRSTVSQNDLGWRAFLPLQLALLLMTLLGLESVRGQDWPARWKRVALLAAVLGVATTALDVALMRFYPMARERAMSAEQKRAARTYSRAAAYRVLDRIDPGQYYVQHNPDVNVDFESGLLGHRRVVMEDWNYGPLYGIDRAFYQQHFDRIAPVFQQCNASAAREVAQRYQIRYWIFQNYDAVWKDRGCWIWQAPAVFRDDQVLVVEAGGNPGSALRPDTNHGFAERAADDGIQQARKRNQTAIPE
jgi:hypothetical protein